MSSHGEELRSKEELEKVLKEGRPTILHFWASWCDASKQMDKVFTHLSADFPQASFLRVEAEEQPEISEAYSVAAVPYFVFFKDGKVVDTMEGANPASLANKVAKIAGTPNNFPSAASASLGMAAGPAVLESVRELAKENDGSEAKPLQFIPSDSLEKRLRDLTNSHPVFLFMKGSPDQPKCGFSRKVVDVLKSEGVRFGTFDILTDDEVREGMKKFANWPTFPMLFCKGELLGGCDIVLAMNQNGELSEIFREKDIVPAVAGDAMAEKTTAQPAQAPSNSATEGNEGKSVTGGLTEELTSRLENLINSSPVMLFIKGKPDEPRCGFSRKVVEILRTEKIEFNSFDVLSDDEVRQGLKVLSNWSSYPQVYVNGELIGGHDIMLEMHKTGELKTLLMEKGIITGESSLEDKLKSLVSSSKTMLFMKGTPDAPRCGFSSKVVDALRSEGVPFGYFDILTDEAIRQGLKTYSNWPTFPQLYHNGELLGGCDIVLELKKSGELKSTFEE